MQQVCFGDFKTYDFVKCMPIMHAHLGCSCYNVLELEDTEINEKFYFDNWSPHSRWHIDKCRLVHWVLDSTQHHLMNRFHHSDTVGSIHRLQTKWFLNIAGFYFILRVVHFTLRRPVPISPNKNTVCSDLFLRRFQNLTSRHKFNMMENNILST